MANNYTVNTHFESGNVVFYDYNVYRQKVKAFQYTYSFDPKLALSMNSVLPKIKNGEISHWDAICHCINNHIPIFVKTSALDHYRDGKELFIFSRIDDLRDKKEVEVFTYDDASKSVFVPVGMLKVNVDVDYRRFL